MSRCVISTTGILVLLVAVAACPVHAEEPWDQREAEEAARREIDDDVKGAAREMGSTVTGRVLAVDDVRDALTVREGSGDEEMHAGTYHIESDTTFFGIDSLADIHVGDDVTIDYYVFHGRNAVDEIVLEKRSHAEEATEKPKAALPRTFVD
jgi:sensor domain CHASE-containing protein